MYWKNSHRIEKPKGPRPSEALFLGENANLLNYKPETEKNRCGSFQYVVTQERLGT
jgi:hypothetical protein